MVRTILLSLAAGVCLSFTPASAHPGHEEAPPEAELERTATTPQGLIKEWLFWPTYILPGRSGVLSNHIPTLETLPPPISDRLSPPRNWLGQTATDRQRRLLTADQLPQDDFTVEFWVTYHVDQPVGGGAMAFDADHNRPALWQFGFWQGDLQFSVGDASISAPVMELKTSLIQQDLESGAYKRGVDRYWHHLVGVFEDDQLRVYHQGKLIATQDASQSSFDYPSGTEFEIAAYLENESYMELGNLIRNVGLYDRALSQEEIAARFEATEQRSERRGRECI